MSAAAARLVARALRRPGGQLPQALLIDGRSGSGKTTLAAALRQHYSEHMGESQLLPVEDLYPGWDGLAEGSRALAAVLDAGEYRRYDWHVGAFTDTVEITTHYPLIIEGCGAISRENLAALKRWSARAQVPADSGIWTVWSESPDELRRRRALARDGETFRPHWDRWAEQENAVFATNRPLSLVHEILHIPPRSGPHSA
ncbi:MAG: hypothetical protein ACTHZ9_03035 [Leucobacter sp.]